MVHSLQKIAKNALVKSNLTLTTISNIYFKNKYSDNEILINIQLHISNLDDLNHIAAIDERLLLYAAYTDNIELFKYAAKFNCVFSEHITTYDVSNDLQMLKYLVEEQGCEFHYNTILGAAEHGNLDCLRYCHEKNAEWDEEALCEVINRGHFDCLKYLHKLGYKLEKWHCLIAVENDNIECLEYLRKNNCPWNIHNCIDALVYLIEEECDYDGEYGGCYLTEPICQAFIEESDEFKSLKISICDKVMDKLFKSRDFLTDHTTL